MLEADTHAAGSLAFKVGDGRRPRALMVDLFGTLVPKWPDGLGRATKARMARHLGIGESAFLDAWNRRYWDRELGRVTSEQCLSEIAAELAPFAPAKSLPHAFGFWSEFVGASMVPRPGAIDALRLVRARGFKVGLVSNAGPAVPPIFQAGPMSSVIDAAVFSCTVGIAKPDPGIYAAACRELGVRPEECAYVGDGSDDELEGARRVGMTPFLLRVEEEIAREGLPEGAAAWT